MKGMAMSKDVQNSLKEAGSKVGDMIDQVKGQAQDAVNQAKDKAQEKGEHFKDKAEWYFRNPDEFKNHAHQQFEDFTGIGKDEFARLYGSDSRMDRVMNFVKDRPVATILLVLIGGLLLSRLCRCCCRSRSCE